MKKLTFTLSLFYTSALLADPGSSYRVIDNSYTVCETREAYQQLITWSLYGVGSPPEQGCFPAPANAKAIIRQCPESDIMICQFELSPEQGQAPLKVWASKVMLKPVRTE